MSLSNRLRVVLVCVALELGVISGVPMRPEQIRELMQQMNRPALAHVLPAEDEDGDGPRRRPARIEPCGV